MKERLTMILACLFLSIGMALAQTRVTGVVTSSEDGEPVIGASVKVKGAAVGAVTDMDGMFTLEVKPGTELTISYLGMAPKTVKAANNMRVVLEPDNKTLQEVVVTGYGSARKLGTIAGSVETVSSDKLANRPVANIGDALQGQVSGVQVFTSSGEPSATTSMRVRGVTSLYATTEPLFILDGSEISQNTFLSLNPNDVESMTVLKDASATAIYGSRAANGVVIITTKRGKFGEAPSVVVSAQYGISQLANDNTTMMNANEWLEFQEVVNPDLQYNKSYLARKDYYKRTGISTDWKKILFGDSKPTYQIDASVRGGTQNVNYLVSFSHYNAQGIMDDSKMRRETIRSNVEININPWLKVSSNTNLAFTTAETTAFGGSGNSVYNKTFAARVYLPTQSYYKVIGLDTNDYANSTFEGYGERLYFFDQMKYYNPYWLSEVQPAANDRISINENLYVNINPIKGLNIRSAIGLDANDYRSHARQLNTMDIDPKVFKTGSTSRSMSRFYRYTVTNTAEYKFNINRKHDVTALVGQETMTSRSEAFSASVSGLTDNRVLTLNAAAQKYVNVPGESAVDNVRNSWFAMLNYGYDGRYYIDLSGRRDGSSLFAANHRWATFGAAAFLWNVTGEKFMESTQNWLNDLQFKVSYGSTGNSGISEYQALGLVGGAGIYYNTSAIAPARPSNDNLTWETVKTFNLALSGKMFNRYSFDLEFYNKVTSNMLVMVPKSYTTGFTSSYGNVASLFNRGVDFTIGVDILKGKDWNWNVKVNGNYNYNRITKLFEGQDSYDLGMTRLEKNHAFGEFYYVRWSHVDPRDGKNVWLDKYGNETKVYSEDDRVMIGKNAVAPWSGGLSSTLSWKGLQLDVQFTGMFGRYLFNNERFFTENPTFASSNNQTVNMKNMWQKPGDITDIAGVNSEVHSDTHLLENASFVRLKFLQLSYNLPQNWLSKTGFLKNAKVYFVTRNLLTFTGFSGYDPEMDGFSTIGDYPNTRQFSFGAQFTF